MKYKQARNWEKFCKSLEKNLDPPHGELLFVDYLSIPAPEKKKGTKISSLPNVIPPSFYIDQTKRRKR